MELMFIAAGVVNTGAILTQSWVVPALIGFILGMIVRGKVG